ncbi:hypothetical protein, partial [Ochrobactrum sp. S1502_03]|uniref:hypothetical protein n=1 Tax=Ochrobactrum sp. S1502_03 TaxID=3108451 RepID=UPI0037C71E99
LLPKRGSTSQTYASSRGASQEPDIVKFIMIQALRAVQGYFSRFTLLTAISNINEIQSVTYYRPFNINGR